MFEQGFYANLGKYIWYEIHIFEFEFEFEKSEPGFNIKILLFLNDENRIQARKI